ncbi:hypothetical protein [Streptomyces sp. 1222.5]|uniref:hypothetical protein n=1 Tax=Streptomyces sp. 1222.5 TaxID=1881026 RepID=UPI003D734931
MEQLRAAVNTGQQAGVQPVEGLAAVGAGLLQPEAFGGVERHEVVVAVPARLVFE